MARLVVNTPKEEDVIFATFSEKIDPKQDKEKTYLIKPGEYVDGVILKISDSPKYKKIYRLKVDGVEKPLIITGKTDLVNKMGHGIEVCPHVVAENDKVRITFIEKTKTKRNNDWYVFEVGVFQ